MGACCINFKRLDERKQAESKHKRDAPQIPPPQLLCEEEPKTKFSELSSRMYDEATSPVHNTGHHEKYHLNATTQKGNGGLVDSVRMLLGDINYNSTSVFGKIKAGHTYPCI